MKNIYQRRENFGICLKFLQIFYFYYLVSRSVMEIINYNCNLHFLQFMQCRLSTVPQLLNY